MRMNARRPPGGLLAFEHHPLIRLSGGMRVFLFWRSPRRTPGTGRAAASPASVITRGTMVPSRVATPDGGMAT